MLKQQDTGMPIPSTKSQGILLLILPIMLFSDVHKRNTSFSYLSCSTLCCEYTTEWTSVCSAQHQMCRTLLPFQQETESQRHRFSNCALHMQLHNANYDIWTKLCRHYASQTKLACYAQSICHGMCACLPRTLPEATSLVS